MKIVDNVLARMTSVFKGHKKQIQHRNRHCEERVWKSHLNYSLAKACLDLLHQTLDQSHGGPPENRFTPGYYRTLSLHLKHQLVKSFIFKLASSILKSTFILYVSTDTAS